MQELSQTSDDSIFAGGRVVYSLLKYNMGNARNFLVLLIIESIISFLAPFLPHLLFSSRKIQNFSPSDSAKTFEKPVNRKAGVRFYPRQAMDLVRRGPAPEHLDESQKRELIQAYLDVKNYLKFITYLFLISCLVLS